MLEGLPPTEPPRPSHAIGPQARRQGGASRSHRRGPPDDGSGWPTIQRMTRACVRRRLGRRPGPVRPHRPARPVAGAPWQTRRPPPAGATTPAIASRSLLFEQIPSVFEQVASAALVTSSPGRGARQLARRRPCFPELQVELSGARRVAVAAAAVGEGSGGNRRRDSACVPRCATTSRCRRPRTPGVVGDSDEDGATLVSG